MKPDTRPEDLALESWLERIFFESLRSIAYYSLWTIAISFSEVILKTWSLDAWESVSFVI